MNDTFFFYSLALILLELQNRMTQMNEGLASLELDRRVASYPDYEEKQLLALNGIKDFYFVASLTVSPSKF